MKTGRVGDPWVVVVAALVLVSPALALGYLSLRAIGVWPLAAGALSSTPGVQVPPFLLLGVSLLAILVILLVSLVAFSWLRQLNQARDREVAAQTRDLAATRDQLLASLADLRSTNAFQQSVLESLSDPMMVIGADYQVSLMNSAARAMSRNAEQLAAIRCYEVGHHRQGPCEGPEHPCPLEQVRESGAAVTVVHEHHQADGRRRFVEVVATPLRAVDGSPGGIVEVLRDITQPVRTAQALRAANRLQQLLVDEVRERISRDLHDGLAQLLGYVNTKVAAVRLMLKNQQLESADEHLLQLEEAARQLFADLRQAIFELRNTGQDGAGLGVALQDVVAQFEQLSGLEPQLSLDPKLEELALPAETELQLLRIAQEALANVRKHACASLVGVSLQFEDGMLVLAISDNGTGFDPGSTPKSRWPHFGLSIMRERAEAIGADFSLASAPATGTRVVVRLAIRDIV